MPGKNCKPHIFREVRDARGFTVLELVVVVAIMMILSAMAVPQIMNTMRTYQLNFAASQVADAVKFSRFEAIRRNNNANCLAATSGATWAVGTDNDGDGLLTNADRQYVFTGNVTFLTAAQVPTAGNLPGAVGVNAVTTLSANSSTQKISFDPRGAVNFAGSTGGAPTVYVFYVGPTMLPAQSYRAVVVMPSGQTQIWEGSPAGNWIQIG